MSQSYLNIGGTPEVRKITLSRAEVRNAFDAELIEQLTTSLGELAEERTLRVLVLAAEGKAFCAGADFRWMSSQKDASFEANVEDAQRLFDMFHALYSFPRPTIARVHGSAFGGGAGLIACCDFVVMAEEAALSFSEVRIGLVPATISPFVIRKIGTGRAREVFLTGMQISAHKAAEIGLANRVVSANELDHAVDEYVATLIKCSPEAIRVTKRLLDEVPLLNLREARDLTAQAIAAQRVSAEGQEGMAAFLEKRKPAWIK